MDKAKIISQCAELFSWMYALFRSGNSNRSQDEIFSTRQKTKSSSILPPTYSEVIQNKNNKNQIIIIRLINRIYAHKREKNGLLVLQ